MNILFVSDVTADPPTSGAEQVLHQQIFGMAATRHCVFAITRLSGRESRIRIRQTREMKIAQYYVDTRNPLLFLRNTYAYPRRAFYTLFESGRPDVVIAHQPFTFFSLIAKGLIKKIPVLYVFHSPNHEEFRISGRSNRHLLNFFESRLRKMLEKKCLLKSDRVMTLSQFMKDQVHEFHGIKSSKISINPGGVNLERFKPFSDREKCKREFSMPVGSIHLLTVRNLDPRMGLDNLLKALRILNRDEPRFHLTIGGEGSERKLLENLSGRLQIQSAVSFLGFILHDDLAKLYSAADFFVLPTRELEGFGLVTPESLACGTPVLGTPVGGTIEILSNFDPAFLFRGNEVEAISAGIEAACEKFPVGGERYAELRRRCREYVEKHYSWQRHNNALNRMVERLVE